MTIYGNISLIYYDILCIYDAHITQSLILTHIHSNDADFLLQLTGNSTAQL